MKKASVSLFNGAPAIMVDGKPLPPMTITPWGLKAVGNSRSGELQTQTPETCKAYYRRLGEAGLRVFYISSTTGWPTLTYEHPWVSPADPNSRLIGVDAVIADVRFLLNVVPDALVMLRLAVSPSREWVNAHPGEQVLFSDGAHRPVTCSTVSKQPIDGMYSLCSDAWRTEVEKGIAALIDRLKAYPEYSHIIGIFLCAGNTSEWYYPIQLVCEDGAYGDFSKPFQRAYSDYLRRKYGTEDRLRRAWGIPDATFDNPRIPTADERRFVRDVDAEIEKVAGFGDAQNPVACSRNDSSSFSTLHAFPSVDGHAVNSPLPVLDYYAAWNEATAETVIRFGRCVKACDPGLLVGAFYGGMGCNDYFDSSTATGTIRILDSGFVDILAAPNTYNNREPGQPTTQREVLDTFRLRGRIFMSEDDTRTHLVAPDSVRDGMGVKTVADSVNIIKRDFARDICADIQGWWFDMGCGWYDDPEILSLFKRQQEIAAFAYSQSRIKQNEIAIIFDSESTHLASLDSTRLALDLYRTSDLDRIGVPVDSYFHDDIARPDMPDYKLYIMLNQFCLTESEREAIRTKARRNNAVVLWLYAPGLLNPSLDAAGGQQMSLENIAATTGIRTGLLKGLHAPDFTVDPASHPALALATAGRHYGIIDRNIHSSFWTDIRVKPHQWLAPAFYIDDPSATILGRYCENGLPAMALTDRDGYRSIYCCAKVVRSDLLKSLAAYAGCHLFLDNDDVLYANENFVMVHASSDGHRTIRFKHPCDPYEVYERRFYGHNVDHLDVDMKHGDTLMWCIHDHGEF